MPEDNKDPELKDPQISITKDMRQLYDQVRESVPQFKNVENKEFFMFALMLGYHNGLRVPIKTQDFHANGFFREKNFTDQERAIFYAIAIEAEKNIEVISNMKQVIKIAQEYAQGGYAHIKKMVFDHGSMENKLSDLLLGYLEKSSA